MTGKHSGGLLIVVVSTHGKQMADQRQTAREGREQKMFECRGALSRTLVGGVGLGLFGKNCCGRVFDKINATFVTASAVLLFVVAGGAIELERSVTPRTEASVFWSIGGTFRTFHIPIVEK